jgi:hypothetical protein
MRKGKKEENENENEERIVVLDWSCFAHKKLKRNNRTKQEVPIKVSTTPPTLTSVLGISYVSRPRRQQRRTRN